MDKYGATHILVKYDGIGDYWNEWHKIDSKRIAKYKSVVLELDPNHYKVLLIKKHTQKKHKTKQNKKKQLYDAAPPSTIVKLSPSNIANIGQRVDVQRSLHEFCFFCVFLCFFKKLKNKTTKIKKMKIVGIMGQLSIFPATPKK